ncbi:unnamed protein product [Victoria cruziana]
MYRRSGGDGCRCISSDPSGTSGCNRGPVRASATPARSAGAVPSAVSGSSPSVARAGALSTTKKKVDLRAFSFNLTN